ncbi:unnamed protein product [Larinioides sclopetarius]|uniref:Uncharacterized protein n=1 Tax=Larinioides sclopetarius TaxID=280406 RepID=A0AAV2B2N0_9ARAC
MKASGSEFEKMIPSAANTIGSTTKMEPDRSVTSRTKRNIIKLLSFF